MNIILDNFVWMGINSILAATAVVFGFLSLKFFLKPLKIFFLSLWLLFLPNTIYILTDMLHFPRQWMGTEGIQRVFLLIQYSFLEAVGIVSFVLSIYFFEKILLYSRFKKNKLLIIFMIILLNFLTAFGVVLGRIQRLNSWDIFTNAEKVMNESLGIMTSVELSLLVLFFGMVGNIIYFLFKDTLVMYFKFLKEVRLGK
ncbi:DUF1361 domain-containing protein [Candidatus Microgenomates bacterium]|nr:MAG: DUF1361 domain-containing protein [Candidatus Microgenomates bacterium]